MAYCMIIVVRCIFVIGSFWTGLTCGSSLDLAPLLKKRVLSLRPWFIVQTVLALDGNFQLGNSPLEVLFQHIDFGDWSVDIMGGWPQED